MKFSAFKAASYAVLVLAAASLTSIAHAQVTTIADGEYGAGFTRATASGGVYYSNSGTGTTHDVPIVDAGSTGYYAIYDFYNGGVAGAASETGTPVALNGSVVSSATLNVFDDTNSNYSGEHGGLLDVFITSDQSTDFANGEEVTGQTGSGQLQDVNTDYIPLANSAGGVANTATSGADGIVSSEFASGSEFYFLGQASYVAESTAATPPGNGPNTEESFVFNSLNSGLVSYVDSQLASGGGLRVIIADDSTTTPRAYLDGLGEDGGLTNYDPTLSFTLSSPAPETSSTTMWVAGAALLGMVAFGMKRRTSAS